MTHPTRAFSGSIINRFTGSKILARVGQISVAFPLVSGIPRSCMILVSAMSGVSIAFKISKTGPISEGGIVWLFLRSW